MKATYSNHQIKVTAGENQFNLSMAEAVVLIKSLTSALYLANISLRDSVEDLIEVGDDHEAQGYPEWIHARDKVKSHIHKSFFNGVTKQNET